MGTHRFFIPRDCFLDGSACLPPAVQSQILKVLRLAPGDEIELLDGSGDAFRARLELAATGDLAARILCQSHVNTEPINHLTLIIALTQREKFEWILQKGTEVGVSAFQPYTSSRTLVQRAERMEKKYRRWEEIVREAAEQSGRGLIPRLMPVLTLEKCLQDVSQACLPLLAAWAEPDKTNLKSALTALKHHIKSIGLIIGPEGGFSAEEQERMLASGAQPFNLGGRTLRMETAATLAPALVLYELGDLRHSE